MALRPIKYLGPLSFEAWEREALKDIKFRAEYTRLGPEFARYAKRIRARRRGAWKAGASCRLRPRFRNTPRPWDGD